MKRNAIVVGEVYAQKRSRYSSSYSRFYRVLDASAGQMTPGARGSWSKGSPGVQAVQVKLDEDSGEWVTATYDGYNEERGDFSNVTEHEPAVVALSKLECTGDEALAKMVEEAERRAETKRRDEERLAARQRVNDPIADELIKLLPDHRELRPESPFRNGSAHSITLNAEQLAKLIGFNPEVQS